MNCLIALGSNLHTDRLTPIDLLSHAIWHMGGLGLSVNAQSTFYRSPADPPGSAPDFVNAVVSARSDHPPQAVFDRLVRIEASLGRARRERGAPRLIDLDILSCDDALVPKGTTMHLPSATGASAVSRQGPDQLAVPHPRMHGRAFVLVPLAEIAPGWRHPVLNRTAAELLAALPEDAVRAIRPVESMEPERNVAE